MTNVTHYLIHDPQMWDLLKEYFLLKIIIYVCNSVDLEYNLLVCSLNVKYLKEFNPDCFLSTLSQILAKLILQNRIRHHEQDL